MTGLSIHMLVSLNSNVPELACAWLCGTNNTPQWVSSYPWLRMRPLFQQCLLPRSTPQDMGEVEVDSGLTRHARPIYKCSNVSGLRRFSGLAHVSAAAAFCKRPSPPPSSPFLIRLTHPNTLIHPILEALSQPLRPSVLWSPYTPSCPLRTFPARQPCAPVAVCDVHPAAPARGPRRAHQARQLAGLHRGAAADAGDHRAQAPGGDVAVGDAAADEDKVSGVGGGPGGGAAPTRLGAGGGMRGGLSGTLRHRPCVPSAVGGGWGGG